MDPAPLHPPPPDVARIMNDARRSPFLATSVYYCQRKLKNRERGRPGNEAITVLSQYHSLRRLMRSSKSRSC